MSQPHYLCTSPCKQSDRPHLGPNDKRPLSKRYNLPGKSNGHREVLDFQTYRPHLALRRIQARKHSVPGRESGLGSDKTVAQETYVMSQVQESGAHVGQPQHLPGLAASFSVGISTSNTKFIAIISRMPRRDMPSCRSHRTERDPKQ